jgi:superfamily II DNA or RNA helicase
MANLTTENMIEKSDLTFFTNEPESTLLDRFKSTLRDTHFFDVLVGYFRASGFYQLYESIEEVNKTRILVGLNVDEEAYKVISEFQNQTVTDFESHANAKKQFQNGLIKEIENSSEDDQRLEIGVKKFIEFLQADCENREHDIKQNGNGKKLEIRAYPTKNIHAKVYIGRYGEEDRDFGFVVTGSSNFSHSGLVGNREFNVQLKDSRDVKYALNKFEDLWEKSVDLSRKFVDTIQMKTWLNDSIQPYELYLKLIYEYLQEDINLEAGFDAFVPHGFMKLEYQQQAVRQALKMLKEHNGVFLADVVGLGKTFITAQLLQQLRGNILVICPPVLQEYWEESLMDFRVPAKVESLGKLVHILRKGFEKYDYIVVDEAHRFRNEDTQSYADLLDICRGKKVILVTATPLNNTIDDIFAQLKLFQAPKNSTIPGVINLEKFFNRLRGKLKKNKPKNTPAGDIFFQKLPDDDSYSNVIKEVSNEIKEKVLRYVMVRRTRNDVETYFKQDMAKQGLTFPELQDPKKIPYQYKGKTEAIFKETISLLAQFNYARYIPLLYYVGGKKLTDFEKQQQKNVGGFMKGILVKRLESSFYAFKKSVQRFISSYERFLEMYNNGTIYISKKVNVYELLDNDEIDTLEEAVEDERAQKYQSKDFRKDYLPDLESDLNILQSIWSIWKNMHDDLKLDKFKHDLHDDPILKNNRIVIFTESKETGDYLFENLIEEYPNEVFFYSGEGGRHSDTTSTSNHNISRDVIKINFDPNARENKNDLRILITTDILAEGINLHRSNVIINYDLPWNPTRVLQRVGRANRLGTSHEKVYIYNFFPTSHSDEHLGLERNITNKIQLFHDILGEDAKYLSEGEKFGSQELFETLNNRKTYSDEDEEGDSELKYLELVRGIRDNNPDLFERIKKLPKKARSGFKDERIKEDELITFFSLGRLKKFYRNRKGKTEEITFFDAVNLLECEKDTSRADLPSKTYFELLNVNKAKFELDTTQNNEESTGRGGFSNVKYIEKRMKTPEFRRYKGFTDADDEFIQGAKNMLNQGLLAKKVAQQIKKGFERETDPLEMLNILRKQIRVLVDENQIKQNNKNKREVILSGYITS